MTLRRGNKRRDSASDIARRLDYDPLRYLIDVGRGTEPPDVVKVGIAKEVLPYVYPKLRSVELTSHQLHDIVVRIGTAHVDVPKDVTHVTDDDAHAAIDHADDVPMSATIPRERSHVGGDDDGDDGDADA